MSAFDATALWDELQKEEDLFRLKIKGENSKKNDNKLWREERNRKENKENNENIERIKSIKHAINLLNDGESDKSVRINCLKFINKYLDDYDNNNDDKKLETMEILKNVIKIFVDPMEPLRSLSIDIIIDHIGNKNKNGNKNEIWNYETSIKYIIPIIVHCILSDEYYEKSEEIRLKFVYLLQDIIDIAQNETEIKPICGDLIAILIKLLNDKYWEINKKVCYLIILLSTKLRLNNVSKIIISATLHLLYNKHSNVLISAIKLIECMLINGGHESIQILTGFREYNVVPLKWWFEGEIRANYFGALCRHKKYSVRNTFYNMIFNIMTNMIERYDYKTLLLSYILTGLQDKNENIQQMTFNEIEKIGKMHENDQYNDLKKILFFQKQAEEIKKKHLGNDDDDNDEFNILPFPFKHRPCLGSRILIREHFGQIINTALSELSDWKYECREMAILLIRNMIIYSEEYCTQNTELLLSSFHCYINVDNDDNVLSKISKQCCSFIGKYVYPIIWIDYLSDIIYHQFDIEWIIILKQLILYCPNKRLYQIRKQIVILLQYVIPFIETSKKINIHQIIIHILTKINNVYQKYENQQSKETENDDHDFKFSSEYQGFHLEIIDETEENEKISNDKHSNSIQQRINIMLNQCQLNLANIST